jgi:hypothetical protein
MNGLINEGVIRRWCTARHGPDSAEGGNEQRPAAPRNQKGGYVCIANGNTSRIPDIKIKICPRATVLAELSQLA